MFNGSRLCMLVGALFASMLPALTQELPEGKGKEVVAATCNSCHPLLARVGSGYTAEGWHTVMRMMVNQGVTFPADQAEVRVAAALGAGGRLLDGTHAPNWWTLASVENHKVDIAAWPDFEENAED